MLCQGGPTILPSFIFQAPRSSCHRDYSSECWLGTGSGLLGRYEKESKGRGVMAWLFSLLKILPKGSFPAAANCERIDIWARNDKF